MLSNQYKTGIKTVLGAAAGLLLASPVMAEDAWWNKDWANRRKITLDAAAVSNLSGPVTAPVLVRLHDANFNFAAKEDGSDIRIIGADGKTALPFYLERYDAFLNNQAFVWVRPESVAPGSKTDFYLYYGNMKPEATSTSDGKSILDDSVVLAYHFSEGGTPIDSSNSGINASGPAIPVEGSLIGGGVRFEPTTTVPIPANPALTFPPNGEMTWSAWVKLTAAAEGTLFSYGPAATGLKLSADAAGLLKVGIGGNSAASTTPLALNTWAHVAVVTQANQTHLYVDGKKAATAAVGLPALEAASFTLGKSEGSPAFQGELDELQIAKVARDDAWLTFTASTQGPNNQDKLLSFAAEEMAQVSWYYGNSTSAVLVRNLTVDGWIVIVLCTFMAIGSWWIMYSKWRLLGGITKGNRKFMEQWKQLSRDLTSLDGTDESSIRSMGGRLDKDAIKTMRQSSVYRLYHIGADELRHRLDAEGGEDAGISARSMEAIKATMDSGLVREGQRLNSLIVLLTICISGGPFLGLLGTVIGVMVTFASIAAAGEVNVSGIAPGIAGALLATVAGLAVAIPALFGYNYIVSKVKEAMADMNVFIDEFITRMAENYPDAKSSTH